MILLVFIIVIAREITIGKSNKKRETRKGLPFCCLLFLFVLGAEVKRHHCGDDDHHVVGSDVTAEREHYEHDQHHKGDDRLDLDEVSDVFNKVYHTLSLSVIG